MKKFYTIFFLLMFASTAVLAQEGTLQSVEVFPVDTALTVGDTIQFSSVVTDTSGAVVDTAVTWSV